MTIETDRLVLREIEEDDRDVIVAYNRDPEVRRYALSRNWDEDQIGLFVAGAIASAARTPRTFFGLAICRKEDMRMIGFCTLIASHPYRETGRMGWELDPRHWGHGYATEAARAMAAYAFRTAGVKEIVCDCFAANRASIRVMQKLGMQRQPGGLPFGLALALWYGQWRPAARHRLTLEAWRRQELERAA